MQADTFNLFIRATDGTPGRYTVSAHDPAEPSVTVDFIPDDKFNTALLKLSARGADRVLRTILEQEPVSAFIGETLFRTFIKDATPTCVSSAFDLFLQNHDAEAPQRIALHLPRPLYRLPWEVLRDPNQPPGQFLSHFHSVIRIDGEAQGPDPRYTRVAPTDPTLQLLFVVSSPSDRPFGDIEPADTGEVKFHRVAPATYSNFQSFTAKTDIRPDGFVFLGHGAVDKGFGALIFVQWQGVVFRKLVSDPRPGYTIGTDLARRARLRFGCLLACETAWIDDQFPFEHSVVGEILNRTKIPFVLGAQTPIAVDAAQEFLTGVVEALQNKEPLDFAVTQGRRRVYALPAVPGTYTALDWWIPVLYSKTISFDLVTEVLPVSIPTTIRGF